MREYQKRYGKVKEAPTPKRRGAADKAPDSRMVEVLDAAQLREIAEEGLAAMTYNLGLAVLQQLFEQDVEAIVGPKGKHLKDRKAFRHGTEQTKVVFGDRKISVRKPRVRSEGHDVRLPTLEAFQKEDPLDMAMVTRAICGVSTRKYARTVEDSADAACVSKSEASRRISAGLRKSMDKFLDRPLGGDTYPVVMADGIARGGMTIIVAMGITRSGRKEVLGLVAGGSENSEAVKRLFSDLIDRGLGTDVPRLFVLDGSKALAKAVRDMFGDMAQIQRCQVHKKRNVLSHLPESEQANTGFAISEAYKEFDYDEALRRLKAIAANLEHRYPNAAASLLEGLEETLTVHRLKLSGLLRITLSNTNAIESANSTASGATRRVSKWKDGEMLLRHLTAGYMEAERGFRRIRGYKDIPLLEAALSAGMPSGSVASVAV